MKKMIKFFREKYKILIPIMALLVLCVTIFFLYKEYKYDSTRKKEEVSVFQYFNSVRVDYKAIITYNLKDIIVDMKAKNKLVDFNNIPIYYEDKSRVIFPTEMNIAFPLRRGRQYKLYKYASYYNVDEAHFINNNNEVGVYEDFFLFNGKNLFFFPYETVLKINNKDYIELGSMSYVSVVGGYTLVYYDAATDKSEVIELDGDIVTVVNENLNVNINQKYFQSLREEILLLTPNNLKPVFKTIDKQ